MANLVGVQKFVLQIESYTHMYQLSWFKLKEDGISKCEDDVGIF